MAPSEAFPNHTHYHSYLLRIWQAGAKGAPVLRFVLISPHTGEQWSFQSMAELVKFLEWEMEKEEEDKEKSE